MLYDLPRTEKASTGSTVSLASGGFGMPCSWPPALRRFPTRGDWAVADPAARRDA